MAAIVGPTGSGKSEVAMQLAGWAGAEIVSVDSMQVYRRMDIGTAKPSPADRRSVVHHMIDLVDPSEEYSVAAFQEEGHGRLDAMEGPALIVGGSGLHFRSLVDPLEFAPTDVELRRILEASSLASLRDELLRIDPDAALHVDLANPRRLVRAVEVARLTGLTPSQRRATAAAAAVQTYEPERPVVVLGIDPADGLSRRIEARFDRMLEEGLLDEVVSLVDEWGPTASQAVGYRQLAPVAGGERSLDEGRRRAIDATTSLARRQRTYFRRDPRIRWLAWHDDPGILAGRARSVLEEAGWSS